MTKSPQKNVPDVGIELGAACMPSELASDRATGLICELIYCPFNAKTLLITEEVTKSGSLLPLGKNSLLSKIGDQRCDGKCYL